MIALRFHIRKAMLTYVLLNFFKKKWLWEKSLVVLSFIEGDSSFYSE